MRKNILDTVMDELGRRRELVKQSLHKDFKNTNPYRKVPISPKEQIMDYVDYLENPEFEQQFLEQGVDPMVIQKYHSNMQNLLRRYQRNA